MTGCSDDDSGAVCGDGVLEGGEVCDGTSLGGQTCADEGYSGGMLGCNASCDGFDVSQCTDDVCGDGAITGTEDCDGANLDMTTCVDLGYDGGDLSCSGTCAFDDSGCYMNCGDDVIQVGDEVCDGADLGGADCVSEGYDAGTLACNADCQGFDAMGCCNDACPADGDTQCTGDILSTCAVAASGCLDWTDTDCSATGDVCDDTGAMAMCRPPCTSDCPAIGATACADATTLNTCEDGGDGCMYWTASACTGGVCAGDPAMCHASGSGDTCQDAIYVGQFPAQFTGTDITADFPTDDYDFDGATNCANTQTGANVDAVFRVDLATGDTLTVTEHGGLDSVIHIVAEDSVSCLDTTACLASRDDPDTTGVTYAATMMQTVYVVVEPYSTAPGAVAYDIRMELVPEVCGDGLLGPSEVCDDGNTAAGDGCAADCSAVETGYECAPGICYATGTGDTCGAPIPLTTPAAFSFDTTSFTDDYGTAVGTDYTACGGSGGNGPDAVFSVDVPDGAFVIAAVTNQTFTAALILSPDCMDIEGTCLTYEESSSATLDGVWHNTTGAAVTIFVVVDSGFSGSAQQGTFDLTVDVQTPVCGNGAVEIGEECDDGNLTAGDGCDALCNIEWLTCGAGETHVTVVSTDVPYTIDNTTPAITSDVAVANAGVVTQVLVRIDDLTHAWDADLDIFLASPSMTQVELSTDNGGSGDNYTATSFLDACSTTGLGPITGGTAPFSGCYSPEGSLATFNGEAAAGTWTLQVTDDFPSADHGALNGWTLELCIQ